MTSPERYIQISEVPSAKAPSTLAVEGSESLGVPTPVDFKEKLHRYFRAEYTLSGRDIIIHFFIPNHLHNYWDLNMIERWWLNNFATVLSNTAEEYFQATLPRIMAKYTSEVASWWFKAQGYDYLLDVDGFVLKFLETLDEALNNAL